VQLWDTSGVPAWPSLFSSFVRNVDGIIFVYDVGDKNSLREIDENWAPRSLSINHEKRPELLLLGNKIDELRTVDMPVFDSQCEEVKNISEKYKMTAREVSAKTGQNV
jgi:GTPase SAR1 family protein